MPRANRYFFGLCSRLDPTSSIHGIVPGHIWHITHRCHKKEFLLKFSRDRQRWLHWLFEVKKRYGLCVLNYVVTSNHIHLLVKDTGESVISKSLQLIAGRTGQEYNKRKNRKGAYWEDRYHATAVDSDVHLFKCLVYVDMNMVRAGVVRHPNEWAHGGYREIQYPPRRYHIIDIPVLMKLCDAASLTDLQNQHREWVEQELMLALSKRDERWSKSIAVGSESFIDQVKSSLGIKAKHKESIEVEDSYFIKEEFSSYNAHFDGKMDPLRVENTIKWDVL